MIAHQSSLMAGLSPIVPVYPLGGQGREDSVGWLVRFPTSENKNHHAYATNRYDANMVESMQRLLKRRASDGTYPRSTEAIIQAFVSVATPWNAHPTPFIWAG